MEYRDNSFQTGTRPGPYSATIEGKAKIFRRLALSLTVLFLMTGATLAAPVLNLPGNPKTTLTQTAVQANCTNRTGTTVLGASCWDTAFISNQVAGLTSTFLSPGTFNGKAPTDQTFSTDFKNWNNANGKAWTMVNGGTLNVTIDVNAFSANVTPTTGGMTVGTLLSLNYKADGTTAAPNLNQLVWTQGLYINYQPGSDKVTPQSPAITLDTASFSSFACKDIPASPDKTTPSTVPNNQGKTSYCDPIYPFQGRASGDAGFYDAPKGYWDIPASFRAIDLLSVVNTKTKTLTVYNDGIDYGFDLSVPEPNFTGLLLVLFVGAFGAYLKKRPFRS